MATRIKAQPRKSLNKQYIASTQIRNTEKSAFIVTLAFKACVRYFLKVHYTNLCSHSQKTKTLCWHGWRPLHIYCLRLCETSSFYRKIFMRNKLNDVWAFPDRIKSVTSRMFISQVTKPIFKEYSEHSEHSEYPEHSEH